MVYPGFFNPFSFPSVSACGLTFVSISSYRTTVLSMRCFSALIAVSALAGASAFAPSFKGRDVSMAAKGAKGSAAKAVKQQTKGKLILFMYVSYLNLVGGVARRLVSKTFVLSRK